MRRLCQPEEANRMGGSDVGCVRLWQNPVTKKPARSSLVISAAVFGKLHRRSGVTKPLVYVARVNALVFSPTIFAPNLQR
jgi:hypothetical protein